jgi:hypothetical protein
MNPHVSGISLGVRDRNGVEAERAGAQIAKPGQGPEWGGYFGYFTDPDWLSLEGRGGGGERPSAVEERAYPRNQRVSRSG